MNKSYPIGWTLKKKNTEFSKFIKSQAQTPHEHLD